MRWSFQDTVTSSVYQMPLNPKRTSPLQQKRATDVSYASPIDGRMNVLRHHDKPVEFTFQGYCLNQQMYDDLLNLVDTGNVQVLTDHMSRQWKVLLLEFSPTDKIPNARTTERYGYQIKGLALGRYTP